MHAGDEYGIVILSTVRSQPPADIRNEDHVQPDRSWLLENLGFLTDEHQINVGITRSKYGLIIVGKVNTCTYFPVSVMIWSPYFQETKLC